MFAFVYHSNVFNTNKYCTLKCVAIKCYNLAVMNVKNACIMTHFSQKNFNPLCQIILQSLLEFINVFCVLC